jgi:excisionase family DNA binding protein
MNLSNKLSYSKQEAAAATSLSVRKIEYLIEQGRLKATKIDRRVLISAKSLQRLIENGVTTGPKETQTETQEVA